MGMNPDESSLPDLAARLAREAQMNADLRAKLANMETSRAGAQTPAPASPLPNQPPETAPSTSFPQPVRASRRTGRRLFSVWQTILLVALALVIGFTVSTFFVSRALRPSQALLGSPYRGDGYTITPLVGWHVQADGSGGVMFSDPRFPVTVSRYASQLGVMVNAGSALLAEFGSSFRLRCQSIGDVAATITLNGSVWQQSQYRCFSLQDGGIASLFRVFSITHGAKNYSIYYLTAIDRLDDFSNGSFETMAQSFTFS